MGRGVKMFGDDVQERRRRVRIRGVNPDSYEVSNSSKTSTEQKGRRYVSRYQRRERTVFRGTLNSR